LWGNLKGKYGLEDVDIDQKTPLIFHIKEIFCEDME
jgi:hypothetical protein